MTTPNTHSSKQPTLSYSPSPFATRLQAESPSASSSSSSALVTRNHPPPHKKRRLLFTSDLPVTIRRYNSDGTENAEWLRQESRSRLKQKWDSIFDRFKDAHLQDQDEIYLGRVSSGENLRIIKDRGTLRQLDKKMEFGIFIKDEELQGWKQRPDVKGLLNQDEQQQLDDPSDQDDDELGRWDDLPPQVMDNSDQHSEDHDDQDDPALHDPQLREFLEAEARRREICGDTEDEDDVSEQEEEEEGEDGDAIIDFTDPAWGRLPQRLTNPQARQGYTDVESVADSSSDQLDIISLYSDSGDEFDQDKDTKRQNVDDLLTHPSPFETLPYDDIPGLAELLQVTTNQMATVYVEIPCVPSDDVTNQADEIELIQGKSGDGDGDNGGLQRHQQVCQEESPKRKKQQQQQTSQVEANKSHPKLGSTLPSRSATQFSLPPTPPRSRSSVSFASSDHEAQPVAPATTTTATAAAAATTTTPATTTPATTTTIASTTFTPGSTPDPTNSNLNIKKNCGSSLATTKSNPVVPKRNPISSTPSRSAINKTPSKHGSTSRTKNPDTNPPSSPSLSFLFEQPLCGGPGKCCKTFCMACGSVLIPSRLKKEKRQQQQQKSSPSPSVAFPLSSTLSHSPNLVSR